MPREGGPVSPQQRSCNSWPLISRVLVQRLACGCAVGGVWSTLPSRRGRHGQICASSVRPLSSQGLSLLDHHTVPSSPLPSRFPPLQASRRLDSREAGGSLLCHIMRAACCRTGRPCRRPPSLRDAHHQSSALCANTVLQRKRPRLAEVAGMLDVTLPQIWADLPPQPSAGILS